MAGQASAPRRSGGAGVAADEVVARWIRGGLAGEPSQRQGGGTGRSEGIGSACVEPAARPGEDEYARPAAVESSSPVEVGRVDRSHSALPMHRN